MPSFTPLLNLLKKVVGVDPNTDTFNIQTMLNDNWDKIDTAIFLKNGNADVRVATTGSISLSGLQTIDGIVLATGDRVLVKNQTAGSQNGIYAAASGSWTRAVDADTTAKLASGLSVYVEEGTANGKTEWRMSNVGAVTLGTTALTFQLMGAVPAAVATANSFMQRDSAGRAQVAAPSAAADIARKDTVDAVQTNLTTHTGTTASGVHGSTSAATANMLMHRDANGRAKVAAPSAADDIARKDTVDAVQTNLTNHSGATGAGIHGSTSAPTANTLIHRDVNGRAQVVAPAAAADIARKDTVDAVQTNLTNHIGTGGTAHAAVVAGGAAGFMTGADKTKLDGIASGAGTANSATDTIIGNRTINDSIAVGTADTDTPTNLFSRIGAMIRAITGKADWHTTPAISLETVSQRLNQAVNTTSSPTFADLTVPTVPKQTTAALTYYVRTDGNDNNNGLTNTAGGAFKTIQKAISSVPRVVNHQVNINIAAGTYAEDVNISGFAGAGAIVINQNGAAPDTIIINSLYASRNACYISVWGMKATKTNANAFQADDCSQIDLLNVKVDAASGTHAGLYVIASSALVNGSTFSNRVQGIYGGLSSQTFSHNNGGTGNQRGLQAAEGGIVHKLGTQPGGTTAEVTQNGGVIVNDAGVINPWGDNNHSNRTHVIAWKTSGAQAIAGNTITRITYQQEVDDALSEFDTSTGLFTAKQAGYYLMQVGCAVNSPTDGSYNEIRMFVNGFSSEIIAQALPRNNGSNYNCLLSGSVFAFLQAGQTLAAHYYCSTSATLMNGGDNNWLRIVRLP